MKLKSGVSRIQFHTSTITDFLSRMSEGSISRFNLSDVMDWMDVREIIALWRQVFRTATPEAVIIWRSVIPTFCLPSGLMSELHFLEEKARYLLTKERTGAYARLFICTLGKDD